MLESYFLLRFYGNEVVKVIVDDFIGKFVYVFLDGCFINVELVISILSIGGKFGD